MPQDQTRHFVAHSRAFSDTWAENARCKADVAAAVERARQQLATARDLLAQLDDILNSNGRSLR